RVQRLDGLAAVLAVHVGIDVVHRTGAVERDDGDDVLEAVWHQLAQGIAHALTFELEYADSVAALEQRIGGRIVERKLRRVDGDTAPGNQLPRRLDHSKGLQAEEVELHEACSFPPFHAQLPARQLRAWIAVERHDLDQGPSADDNPGGVGRTVGVWC